MTPRMCLFFSAVVSLLLLGWSAVRATSTAAASTERVIYALAGGTDGAIPTSSLIADAGGTLYGTTGFGGSASSCQPEAPGGCGTAFKLLPTASGYAESVLYRFAGGNDGSTPIGGLVGDATGALYGTTSAGGGSAACPILRGLPKGCGTVFKLTPTISGYAESVLYRFTGGSDGAIPTAGLLLEAAGTLYGTASQGGSGSCQSLSATGCGTVFKLTPKGGHYAFTTLYRFSGGADGAYPQAGLIADRRGSLYGTTIEGGNTNCSVPSGPPSCGVVFRLSRSGSHYKQGVLYRFKGFSDGLIPLGGVIADDKGNLFGTTEFGGNLSACGADDPARPKRRTIGPLGCGTVFELAPSASGYSETIVFAFDGRLARYPYAGLTFGNRGRLYGTTASGGYGGSAFRLTRTGSGYALRVLHSFSGNADGAGPVAALLLKDGVLYGTTQSGGAAGCQNLLGCGTVFAVAP